MPIIIADVHEPTLPVSMLPASLPGCRAVGAMGQVKLLPMLDELCVLGLSGTQLHRALENGVSQYPKLEGRFPCVSGVRFSFDPALPPNARVDPA
eukprot:COSAG01_NODE_29267_length_641_cov_1.376384_1_plen_94_part_10